MEEFEEITQVEDIITVGEVIVTKKTPKVEPIVIKPTKEEILKRVEKLDDKDPFSESSDLTGPKVKVAHIKSEPTFRDCSKEEGFISTFINYIQSSRFYEYIANIASNKKLSKKLIAKTFFARVLGTLGDVLEIGINTVEELITGVVKLLSDILKAGAHLICNTARSISRIITLNNTCIEK